MIIETVDPGVAGVREAVKEYVEKFPDFAQPLRMYGAIMEAQQEALSDVTCHLQLSAEEKERRLRNGEPVLDPRDLEIDPVAFVNLLKKICRAVDEGKPGGSFHCDALVSWEGLKPGRIADTRDHVLSGESLPKVDGLENEGDRKIVSNIIWETLVPFYRKCGSILCGKMEQSYWQRGFCPVCGSAPLIGMFRSEDGLWLLECALCHTIWNLQRASCAFCDESQGSLEYLYLEEDPEHRVQYCDRCRVYVKTVDLRDSGRDVLLPLEDIVTIELDLLAANEGLEAARDKQA